MTKSVFISSTSKDLKDHREAVNEVIRRLRLHPVDMIDFGAQPGGAKDVSVKEVRTSDFFIGILAHRYGYVMDGQAKSVTEQEYDEAVRHRKPRLIYLVDPAYSWDAALIENDPTAQARLSAFKARLNKTEVRGLFTTPENLATQVSTDLAKLVQERSRRLWLIRGLMVVASLILAAGIVIAADTGLRNSTLMAVNLIDPTATPGPDVMPAGFNVVVAGFGEQQADGTVRVSQTGDDFSDLLTAELGELGESGAINNLRGWRDRGVGHILSADPQERAAQAKALAELLNADVVIYGLIRPDEAFAEVEPEYYLAGDFAAIEPEFAGAGRLGEKLAFLRGSDDDTLGATSQVQGRITILRNFLRGLSLYIRGDFAEAEQAFEAAYGIEQRGFEVIAILGGNSALRLQADEKAFEWYSRALDTRSNYARAYLGRGASLYQMAYTQADTLPDSQTAWAEESGEGITCDRSSPIPTALHPLAGMALDCYQRALNSDDQPVTGDVWVKGTFATAQLYAWQALNDFEDVWPDALDLLNSLIAHYENDATPDEQSRTRAFAAQAHAYLGLYYRTEGQTVEDLETAIGHYEAAIALLEADINRDYNQSFIETYQSAIEELEISISNFDVR